MVVLAGADPVDDADDPAVDDPPTTIPPVEGELSVALDMVVFLEMGTPVPPAPAAVPTVVVTTIAELLESIDERVPLREDRAALTDEAASELIGTGMGTGSGVMPESELEVVELDAAVLETVPVDAAAVAPPVRGNWPE